MSRESKAWQWFAHTLMTVMSALCIVPFVLLLISSISSEKSIIQNGYSFFPQQFSFSAYQYLLQHSSEIAHAYSITIFITIVGTTGSLVVTSLLAYPLSRQGIAGRSVISFLVFFTLLFNGGLVPTYLVYTHVLDLKNTIWALIVPSLFMNGFNVLLMRTFFTTTIPVPIIESANIDGAGEFKIFYSIVLPLSLPIMATIGLFQAIAYWNDWFNGMTYLTDAKLYSIQNILNRILTDIQFLSSGALGSNTAQAAAELPSTTVRMAIAVIGVIPILVAYPFFQKYFIKGITVGSVKG
jgi:putative aldouronate transport system permease protein